METLSDCAEDCKEDDGMIVVRPEDGRLQSASTTSATPSRNLVAQPFPLRIKAPFEGLLFAQVLAGAGFRQKFCCKFVIALQV